MERLRSQGLIVLAATALLVLAGCSSGSKNNNNNGKVATTSATTAAPIATVLRTPSPAPRTPTPAATLAQAAPLRTPTPSAAGDPVLQQALAGAALKSSDLPPGYLPMGAPDTSLELPGETASYQQIETNLTTIPNLGLLIDGLLGFKDVASAQAAYANLQTELQSADASLNLKLTPVPASTKLGDDTQVYMFSLTTQGFTFNGFLVAWRRGRIGGTVALAGSGTLAPTDSSDVVALAQKQDGYLQSVKQ